MRKLIIPAILALLTLPLWSSPSQAGATSDADLFAAYDQVNTADIEVARLGAIKGSTEALRTLAAMVLHDHTMVRQIARDMAGSLKIAYEVPTDNELAKSHAEVIARLSKLEGPAFDRAYLAHELPFHLAAVKAVREILIPQAKSPKLRAHLNSVLPHFEMHIDATRSTAEALGIALD